MKNTLQRGVGAAALALAAAGFSGCAAQPADNSELIGRVERAERSAAEAQQAAARAQARADEAAAMAQANNEKIDRAFQKAQQK